MWTPPMGPDLTLAPLLAGAVLGWLACWLVARRRSRRLLSDISRTVCDIGQGRFGRRLSSPPGSRHQELVDAVNGMAQAMQARVIGLETRLAQLEALFAGMREGVLVLDRLGRITTVNKALADLFPQPSGHVGKSPIEVIPSPEFQEACFALLGPKPQARQRQVRIELEKDLCLEVSLVRLERGPEEGEGGGAIVAVFHDRSENRRLELLRRDFVANVSHELRTPLTSIKGYAETLLDTMGEPCGAGRPFLEIILKNANHMSKMVAELLDLAKLQARRSGPPPVPVDPCAALGQALKECAPLAEEKHILIDDLLPRDAPQVLADASGLTQVFRNLLENAVKYSPKDSRVAVSRHDDNTFVTFMVQDQGPGVAPEDRERVFERFYRVEKHRSKAAETGAATSGTGLGLAIAKHIVERHGGSIWAGSAGEAPGAVFSFSLKRAPVQAVAVAVAQNGNP